MSESDTDDWRALAADLHEHGGVPERRAEVVALLACGRTHQEVQETLGLSSRGQVSVHVEAYREEDLPAARWLAEHGPDV